jgi:hypothetical protein
MSEIANRTLVITPFGAATALYDCVHKQ